MHSGSAVGIASQSGLAYRKARSRIARAEGLLISLLQLIAHQLFARLIKVKQLIRRDPEKPCQRNYLRQIGARDPRLPL